MSRSLTLMYYQKGYVGQPIDIEATKPRFVQAYCLGVGDVAAGKEAMRTGLEVRERLVSVSLHKQQVFLLSLVSYADRWECIKALRAASPFLDLASNTTPSLLYIVDHLPAHFDCKSEANRQAAIKVFHEFGAVALIPRQEEPQP